MRGTGCASVVREHEAEELVRPVVEAAGLELWDVTFRLESGRRVLRVVVDREGGVDIDTISATSERVSRRLDLEGFAGDETYALEVSSPGLERSLRAPEHFRRSIGARVRLKTVEPVDGRRTHEGVLDAADDDGVVLDVDGSSVRVPYAGIASARTVFEWGARSRS